MAGAHRAPTLRCAEAADAPRGQVTEVSGALGTAAAQAGHAVLAAHGEWITDEKRLLTLAGLRCFDALIGGLGPEPAALVPAVEWAGALLEAVGRRGAKGGAEGAGAAVRDREGAPVRFGTSRCG
ncbi:hypothetical protein AB0939_15475 [Streptomyces sp. NPDC006990]|uniref:hypothetical protein n=1 Tax=unclassified Streptomyces TaxID=2593676 RepID=UPI003455062B